MLPKDFTLNIKQSDAIQAILELVILMKVDIEMLKDAELQRQSVEKSISLDDLQDTYSNEFLALKINEVLKALYERFGYIDKKDIGLD